MEDYEMYCYSILVMSTVVAFEMNDEYSFSFMGIPALLMFCILFIGFAWFPKSWFYYCWGILTSVVIIVPMITQLLNHSNNTVAFVFDGIISLFLIIFYGIKIYKKIKMNKERVVNN